ncbi:MAG: lysophospholipid acyltransferase family protein [Pyrinomonadaceae bacterium]
MKETNEEHFPAPSIVAVLKFAAYLISKTFWFIKYQGREFIRGDSRGGFIIAANHQTYIDPIWICLPIRHKLRFLAIEKAFSWRFVGPLIAYMGAIPVSHEPSGSITTMKSALRALKQGAALTVFPEGARQFAHGGPLPFKSGAVGLALKANVPILPVTIRGGNLIWPQKQKYPRVFRRVEIIYHPPLQITDDRSLTMDENLEHWTTVLKKIIEEPRRGS